MIQSHTKSASKLKQFRAGTCFDSVVEAQQNERLAKNIPFLLPKDTEPKSKVPLTDKQKAERKELKFLIFSKHKEDYQRMNKEFIKIKETEKQKVPISRHKIDNKPPPEHDRESVRSGKIFASQEQFEYVQQLQYYTNEYVEQTGYGEDKPK